MGLLAEPREVLWRMGFRFSSAVFKGWSYIDFQHLVLWIQEFVTWNASLRQHLSACAPCWFSAGHNIHTIGQHPRQRLPFGVHGTGYIWSYSWTSVRLSYFLVTVRWLRICFFIDRNYVDSTTAMQQNLTFASSDHFILRADSKTILSASGPGRNSIRLRSNKQYTTSVMVWVMVASSFEKVIIDYLVLFRFNIRHMPQGCG